MVRTSSTGTSSSGGSSSGGSSGTPDTGPAAPTASATSITLYLGNVARLDGTSSTGALSHSWTFKTVPAGSAIAPASLTGANAAVVTFVPDKLGLYELELLVTANGQTGKTTVTATVVDPPVFYFDSNAIDGGQAARLLVTGATAGDGGPGKPVACFERDAGGAYNVRYPASSGTDWWEAPAGQPSKAAFIMDTAFDGGQAAALFATTSNGSCAAAPTKVDSLPPPTSGTAHTFEQPRISPDGNRVAYARQAAEGAQVVAAGLDGMNVRILGSRMVDNDGGPRPDAGLEVTPISRPFWQGNTHVAWIENIAGDAWQIARAPDAANATREVLARCTGSPPSQGAFLPNGEVVVSQEIGGQVVLVAYPIVAATKTCGAARIITPVPDGGSFVAFDFQLSPDGTEIAFLGPNNEPHIVKADGLSPARKIANVGTATRGPRWVGNGAFVSWGVTAGSAVDAGIEAGAIFVAQAEGGTPEAGVAPRNVPVVASNAEAIGNGFFSCSIGNGVGSGVAFAGVAGIAVLRLLRRRRR